MAGNPRKSWRQLRAILGCGEEHGKGNPTGTPTTTRETLVTTHAWLRSPSALPQVGPHEVEAFFDQGPAGDLEDHVAARLRDFHRSGKPAPYDATSARAEMAGTALPGD